MNHNSKITLEGLLQLRSPVHDFKIPLEALDFQQLCFLDEAAISIVPDLEFHYGISPIEGM